MTDWTPDLAALSESSRAALRLLLDVSLKGTLVLLGAAVLGALLRRQAAAARHLVWSLALASLLALPPLALLLPTWKLPLLRSAATLPPAAAPTEPTPEPALATRLIVRPPAALPVEAVEIRPINFAHHWPAPALALWLLGALAIGARLLAGTCGVWWLARRAAPVTDPAWTSLAGCVSAQLRLRRPVRLLRSERVAMPMTWGSWRSVVLLPTEADGWSAGWREIVLLHELAHVKRRDCLTQTLAQVACALYWFNPLVWAAARRLRQERELACDDHVLCVGTRASEYARYLVEIASTLGRPIDSLVTVGMACSQLEGRVRAILDPGARRRGLSGGRAALALMLALGLVAPLAALRPWVEAAPATQTIATTGQSATSPEEPQVIAAVRGQETTPTRPVTARPAAANDEPEGVEGETEASEAEAQEKSGAAGLTAEQIIEMKVAGVTPEYVEMLRRQGYSELSGRQIANLSRQGVTEDFIKEARGWGAGQVTAQQLLKLKIAGVDAAYLQAIKQTGYDNLPVNKLFNLKIHGVTPEYIAALRRFGYDKLTADQLAGLKIHGVDEEFIRETQGWLPGKPSAEELMQLKIHGVTPEFARVMKGLGYGDLSLAKLTQMKIHGVDEGFVKEMRGLGFDNLTLEQLLQFRIHGVTPDYVKKMRAAGLKNVSADELIRFKIHGIDAILLKN